MTSSVIEADDVPCAKSGNPTSHPTLISIVVFAVISLVHATSAEAAASRLIGTMESNGIIGAVIDDSTSQTFYRLHEKLPDGSEVVEVRNDSISLKRSDGEIHDMYINHEINKIAAGSPIESPAIQSSGGSQRIPHQTGRKRHVRPSSADEE